MGIRSYAQNFEDVLLFRALGHVDNGFYIDVGAADPVLNSVTKAFYDQGWSGVNVEPVEASWKRLDEQRPRDVNLNVALGASHGTATLHVDSRWTDISTLDPEALVASGRDPEFIREVSVPVWTLAEVCERFARPAIHFLKVDVEGFELEVLRGGNFAVYRPWVAVVEVQSLDRRVKSDELDRHMQAIDYRPVFFDGLNRFFVATEMYDELGSCFLEPVNVKDDFALAAAEQEAAALAVLAELLHATSSSPDEIHERVTALIADRYMAVKAAESAATGLAERARLRIEIDLAYQEIYELSRHIGGLTMQRNNAVESLEPVSRRLEEVSRLLDIESAERQRLVAELESATRRLASVTASRSWRVTAPLRRATEKSRGA